MGYIGVTSTRTMELGGKLDPVSKADGGDYRTVAETLLGQGQTYSNEPSTEGLAQGESRHW